MSRRRKRALKSSPSFRSLVAPGQRSIQSSQHHRNTAHFALPATQAVSHLLLEVSRPLVHRLLLRGHKRACSADRDATSDSASVATVAATQAAAKDAWSGRNSAHRCGGGGVGGGRGCSGTSTVFHGPAVVAIDVHVTVSVLGAFSVSWVGGGGSRGDGGGGLVGARPVRLGPGPVLGPHAHHLSENTLARGIMLSGRVSVCVSVDACLKFCIKVCASKPNC